MIRKEYSMIIAEAVKTFLREDELSFSFDENAGLIKLGVNISGKLNFLDYLIVIKESSYLVDAACPLRAEVSDEKMMAALAEYVCRVNYGLPNGDFELGMDNGEIRYKIHIDCRSGMPNAETVKHSIIWPAIMFERYGTGFTELIFSSAKPKDIIKRIESSN